MTITLKFAATCRDCGTALPVGTRARWYKGGKVYGIGCHAPAAGKPASNAKTKTDAMNVKGEAMTTSEQARADALASSELESRVAAKWGDRAIRFGVAKASPFQAYWRARLAARAAFRAVTGLRG